MGLTNLTTYLYRGYNPVTKYHGHPSTVDGSEIRRAPVEVGSSHYLQGFSTIPGGVGFLNHQQYQDGVLPYQSHRIHGTIVNLPIYMKTHKNQPSM